VNRGLVNSLLFTGSGGPASTARACIFGAFPAASGTLAPSVIGQAAPAAVTSRIDSTRGYVLEDDLVYTLSTADTPNNSFLNGVSGPREFRSGVSWGATLSFTGTAAASSGTPATLSIAVVKKLGDVRQLALTATSGLFLNGTNSGTNALQAEVDRKQFLPGCSYVLALPISSGSTPPTWLKITSSWTNPGPLDAFGQEQVNLRTSYVVLDTRPISDLTAFITSGTLTVLAFENIVRVDQYPVTLD
jgi:hypothetical protein